MEMQAYKPEVHRMQSVRTSFAGETGSYKVIEIKGLPKVVLPGKDKISVEPLVGWQMENMSFQSREELKDKKRERCWFKIVSWRDTNGLCQRMLSSR